MSDGARVHPRAARAHRRLGTDRAAARARHVDRARPRRARRRRARGHGRRRAASLPRAVGPGGHRRRGDARRRQLARRVPPPPRGRGRGDGARPRDRGRGPHGPPGDPAPSGGTWSASGPSRAELVREREDLQAALETARRASLALARERDETRSRLAAAEERAAGAEARVDAAERRRDTIEAALRRGNPDAEYTESACSSAWPSSRTSCARHGRMRRRSPTACRPPSGAWPRRCRACARRPRRATAPRRGPRATTVGCGSRSAAATRHPAPRPTTAPTPCSRPRCACCRATSSRRARRPTGSPSSSSRLAGSSTRPSAACARRPRRACARSPAAGRRQPTAEAQPAPDEPS